MPLFGTVFTAQPSQIRVNLQGRNILQGAAFEVAGDAANDIAQDIADVVSGSTKYTAASGKFTVTFDKGDVTPVAATTYENGQKKA